MTRRQLSLRLLSITRRVLPPLAASIAARIVFLMIGIALFALGGWAVAGLASGESAWSIALVIVCAIGLSLLKGLARYLEQFAGHFVAFHSLAMLRNYFYDQLEPQAPAGTDRLDSGDIMNRVTKDIDRVEVFFAHTLAPVTTVIIVPILSIVWMGSAVSWTLAAVLAPFLLIVGAVIPFLGSGSTARAARELREARGAIAAHVTDSVQGVREVLAFGAEERREAEMSAIEKRISAGMGTQGRWIALRRGLNQAAVALGVGVAPAEASSSLSSFGGVNLPVPSANLPVAPGAAAKPVAPASSRVQNIINYTNDYRKAHGLRPVRANGALNGLAQDWANQLVRADKLSHRPQHWNYYPANIPAGGENVLQAWSDYSDAQLVKLWYESPGHRKIMLDPRAKTIGVGVAINAEGKLYAVQNYGR